MGRKGDAAAYYEAHKDDPDLWEEVPTPPPAERRRKGLAATITVRFSVEEAEAIRRVAQERALSYSQVVREAVARFTRPRVLLTTGTTCHLHRPRTITGGGDTAQFRRATEEPTTTHTGPLVPAARRRRDPMSQ
jgi:hypothetical protein